MGPNSMTGVFIKREKIRHRKTKQNKTGRVLYNSETTQVEIGCICKLRDTKDFQEPPEDRKRQESILP